MNIYYKTNLKTNKKKHKRKYRKSFEFSYLTTSEDALKISSWMDSIVDSIRSESR